MPTHATCIVLAGLFACPLALNWTTPLRSPAAQDSKKPEVGQNLEQKIQTLAKDYFECKKSINDGLVDAKDDKGQEELLQQRDENRRQLAEKLEEFLNHHPADPAALEAILLLIEECRRRPNNELIAPVLEHHLAHPKLGVLCYSLRYETKSAEAERLLKAAAAKHPDPAVRGIATYSLGVIHRFRGEIDACRRTARRKVCFRLKLPNPIFKKCSSPTPMHSCPTVV